MDEESIKAQTTRSLVLCTDSRLVQHGANKDTILNRSEQGHLVRKS